MLVDPRKHPIRDRIRAFLGTDPTALEATMTTMLELLTGLVAKTTEASAAQQASFLNLHNAVGKLTSNVARLEQLLRDGDATEEMQTLAAEIRTNLDDMRKAADTADDGFEPIEEPTPEVSAEPTPAENPPVVEPETPAVDETGRRGR